MFLHNLNDGYFLIFYKQKPCESTLFSVTRDNNLLKNTSEKFEQCFHKILRPEKITRTFDVSDKNNQKAYCF